MFFEVFATEMKLCHWKYNITIKQRVCVCVHMVVCVIVKRKYVCQSVYARERCLIMSILFVFNVEYLNERTTFLQPISLHYFVIIFVIILVLIIIKVINQIYPNVYYR